MTNWKERMRQRARDRARALAGPRGTTIPGTGNRFPSAGRQRKMHVYARPRKGGGARGHREAPWGPRIDRGPDE